MVNIENPPVQINERDKVLYNYLYQFAERVRLMLDAQENGFYATGEESAQGKMGSTGLYPGSGGGTTIQNLVKGEDWASVIQQTAESIMTEVRSADSALASRITQTATTISSEVSRATEAEVALSSRITQTADSISTKVSKGSIISEINQSAEEIKIRADKLTFTGLVTISALGTAGAVTINGGNITADTINANRIRSNTWEGLNLGSSGGYLNNIWFGTGHLGSGNLWLGANYYINGTGITHQIDDSHTEGKTWQQIINGSGGTAVFG